MSESLRIVFCGSGVFGIPTLRALAAGRHELVEVITQPARPAGRGGRLTPTPLAEAAAELGLTPIECENVNEPPFVRTLRDMRADVLFVADFGQFIREDALATPALDAINLHGSILPELRGAAPINWAIIRGYRRTGVSTFSIVMAMDAGDVYRIDETDISPDETAEELKVRLAEIGSGTVTRTLDGIASGELKPTPQDHSKATKAPRLKKEDGELNFTAPAEELRNRIHGTWPWPGGQAIFRKAGGKDREVTIARAAVAEGEARAEPGVLDEDLCVSTGAGRLEPLEVKPAGKKRMAWKDFVNGARAKAGDRLAKPW